MSLDTKKIDGNPKYCHPPTREGDLCKPTRYKDDFVKTKLLIHNTTACNQKHKNSQHKYDICNISDATVDKKYTCKLMLYAYS